MLRAEDTGRRIEDAYGDRPPPRVPWLLGGVCLGIWGEGGPKEAKMSPRWATEGPRSLPKGPRWLQDDSKMASRRYIT